MDLETETHMKTQIGKFVISYLTSYLMLSACTLTPIKAYQHETQAVETVTINVSGSEAQGNSEVSADFLGNSEQILQNKIADFSSSKASCSAVGYGIIGGEAVSPLTQV